MVGGGGTVNFLTGAGGFLQNVVFGYFGFELTASSLSFNPQLPQGVTALTAVNVDYLGNSFDFTFDENDVTVTVKETRNSSQVLHVCVANTDKKLSVDTPLKFKRASGDIKSSRLQC